jgi:hypothetical protein
LGIRPSPKKDAKTGRNSRILLAFRIVAFDGVGWNLTAPDR